MTRRRAIIETKAYLPQARLVLGETAERCVVLRRAIKTACVVAALLVGGARAAAAAGLSVYDVVSGNLAAQLNPTFNGGAFDGQTLDSLSIHDIAGYRDTNTAQLALFSSARLSVYDVVSGNLAIELNPTFSGGAFAGQTLNSLSIHDIAGYRDIATAQLALFSASGLSVYDVVSGNLAAQLNPTFSGGAFAGQTLNSLSIHDIAGYRDTNTAQLALFSTSGLSVYDIVSGNLAIELNPRYTGGAFDGQTLDNRSIDDIVGNRDTNTGQLALFQPIPEPSTVVTTAIAVICLGLMAYVRK